MSTLSSELTSFFCLVASREDLQKQLKCTKEVVDAAMIARGLGFQVSDAEVMCAQANRILAMPQAELEKTACGFQAEFGAQWGRGGTGYLNLPGYWLTRLDDWQRLPAGSIRTALRAHSIIGAKTVDEIATQCGVNACDLLLYLARSILMCNDAQLAVIAKGEIL